ncbi:MAG: membrane protein insertase YidC [Actinobacteria bacterium]|nr:membrane protein insertase YidC [Actinomycetota bacterium]MCB8997015.1 membrane protein insertase YidC [Actinomycetota bacterium]MCB9413994.1 membrane protein insertase YidC [Actinomycetota bacterium]MCB9424503.1 membrane protein insertase YidC [Actinomycetota bacterium]
MFILEWLEIAVSWILVTFHSLLSPIFGAASGAAWGLSIVGLVIVIRILLIPLFVKQIKAQRNLQLIQPQMKEIQQKYAGDRQRQSEEMMKLYRESGTNPLSSCLPILVQAPIFFALFRVLQGMAQDKAVGVLTPALVAEGREASIFGVPIYGTFMNADETPNPTATRVVTLVMIILMSATTFITQRQLIVKNTAADNPIVRQQKLLLYIFPVMFAIGGINFPLGVLIYWLTTNLWSMGQQFWVIRNNPQPGTPAFDAKAKRDAAKAEKKGGGTTTATVAPEVVEPKPPARNQPKRQSRKKRKGS